MLFEGKNERTDLQGLDLKIGNQIIEQVGSNCKEKYFKFVGHVLDDKLTWGGHLEHICKKTCKCQFCNKFNQKMSSPKSKENVVLQPF